MIVKVQLSLHTTQERRRVLVYNEDRSVWYEADASQEVINLLAGEPKTYFKAHLDKDKKLILDGKAPDQIW